MAAVHYLRLTVPAEALALLEDGVAARLVVDHPNYQAEAVLPTGVVAQLRKDLQAV